jgi:hypothetical protein
MFIYFYILERRFYHDAMKAPLAESYARRSFVPCVDLCRRLLATNSEIPKDSLIHSILSGLPFERQFWHGLIGECLVHGATDIPRLNTAPESLCSLLAPQFVNKDVSRPEYPTIFQCHFGTRDLRFGSGYHRPDKVGLNDTDDVERLAGYLEGIDPTLWKASDLDLIAELADDEQRAEELAYVRDWFPSLVEVYQAAGAHDWIVICERM